MTIWVAMLRGVNVGGHNKLAMADFRSALTADGLEDVATYIQSGNVVFRAAGDSGSLEKRIAGVVQREFGFEPDVFVLSLDQMRTALARNPFPQALSDPAKLHLMFMKNAPDLPRDTLEKHATNGEQFHLVGDVLYLYTPNGFGTSELAARIGNHIKVPTTARNLRSSLKIADLAAKLPPET